jgi:hypothetical protein
VLYSRGDERKGGLRVLRRAPSYIERAGALAGREEREGILHLRDEGLRMLLITKPRFRSSPETDRSQLFTAFSALSPVVRLMSITMIITTFLRMDCASAWLQTIKLSTSGRSTHSQYSALLLFDTLFSEALLACQLGTGGV